MKIDANQIRDFVVAEYFREARSRGKRELSIAAGDVERKLRKRGLERGRVPAVCSVLRGNKLQKETRAKLDRQTGPPSGQGPNAVFHFTLDSYPSLDGAPAAETPAEKAHRLVEVLRGLLGDEIAAHGGAEAYLRWIRSEDEEEAA